VLAHAKKVKPDLVTKTSVMLGLGETKDEVSPGRNASFICVTGHMHLYDRIYSFV